MIVTEVILNGRNGSDLGREGGREEEREGEDREEGSEGGRGKGEVMNTQNRTNLTLSTHLEVIKGNCFVIA